MAVSVEGGRMVYDPARDVVRTDVFEVGADGKPFVSASYCASRSEFMWWQAQHARVLEEIRRHDAERTILEMPKGRKRASG